MHFNSHILLKKNTSILHLIQQVIHPVLAISLLFILSQIFEVYFSEAYFILAIISCLLILLIYQVTGLYDGFFSTKRNPKFLNFLSSWSLVIAVLSLTGYLTKTGTYFSRSLLITWAVLVPVVQYSFYFYLVSRQKRMHMLGYSTRTAVIAGLTKGGLNLAKQIKNSPFLGIQLLGFFVESNSTSVLEGKVLGSLADLPAYVRDRQIDIVYIAVSQQSEATIQQLIEDLQDTTACVYFIPNLLLFNLMQATVYEMNGIPMIAVWEIPFSDLQHTLKRILDCCLASFALIILSPLLLLIAIGVKLSSPGPILFKQRRYGFNSQDIVVYKFRTMTVMENGDVVQQARRDDPRITPFGAFLRKTSLDELPQLINVLQGRMSIVGPRPHAVAHNEYYRKLIRGYMLRHKVKPGITGLAQVNGFRGETDTLDKMKKRIEYDLHYLKHWSLALDLQIIFKTALVFLGQRNAY
mgnify:CR=1 FL=1